MQRYDPDPAAKAAAATVLASKLGADSGLKVVVGDDAPSGKSSDVELVQSGGLRNRKQAQTRSSSAGTTPLPHSGEATPHLEKTEGPQPSEHNQLVVSHHDPLGSATQDGGWIARIAALLVGEDPTQSYALICGNCHMHNGEWPGSRVFFIDAPFSHPVSRVLFRICWHGETEFIFLFILQGLQERRISHSSPITAHIVMP